MLSYRSRTQYHHMPGYFHRSVISLQLQYYCESMMIYLFQEGRETEEGGGRN